MRTPSKLRTFTVRCAGAADAGADGIREAAVSMAAKAAVRRRAIGDSWGVGEPDRPPDPIITRE
ncbi:hypothetical protein GCM10022221_11440 [Actinocorallia aurea]